MDRIIETDRLHLRPLHEGDTPTIVSRVGNYAIARNLARVPHPYHLSDADAFLNWTRVHTLKSRFSAICMRGAANELLGIISYEWNEANEDAELGYWIDEPFWGQGLMSEAAGAMVEHAFAVAGIEKMVSCHFDENPASGKVLRRAGFEVGGACQQFSRAQNKEVPVTNMQLTRVMWANKKAAPSGAA